MGKYSRKYIGQEFPTNEGYVALVIDGGDKSGCCMIKIKDLVSEVGVKELKNGKIKYPYHLSVYGVGYVGKGKYKHYHNASKIWSKMIERCYRKRRSIKNLSYVDCEVCKEWLNMQVFAEWYDENRIEGFEMDKDLLSKGKKVYSPETCVFIPQCLNTFVANKKSNNTSGYTGVSWHKQHKKWQAQISDVDTQGKCYIGIFDTAEEASEAYQLARSKMADRMRDKMINEYDVTDTRILDAIK